MLVRVEGSSVIVHEPGIVGDACEDWLSGLDLLSRQ
jgi:hypothetical protein